MATNANKSDKWHLGCGNKCQKINKWHLGSSHYSHNKCALQLDRLSIQCQTHQGINDIKARRKSPSLCVLNQVMSKLSTVTTDSIVTGSLRTSSSSSSKGSGSAFMREANENDAGESQCKSPSSSDIAKSS
jgi:hypothetical protein